MEKEGETIEIELTEIPINDEIKEEAPPAKEDVSDIKNYYFQKTKQNFSDIINYLYKQKIIITLGVIFSFILLLLYFFIPTWRDMGWEGWFSIIVAEVAVILLVGNILPPALVFLLATTICYFVGIINSAQALEGFSNSGIVSIGVLFIVAKTVEMSDVLKYVVKYVLRHPKSLIIAQVRLLIPVTVLSGFINNTPLVALLIPVVQSWSNQCGFSASQLLMPLSFAAIIGGTCTLIGTSTNLIVLGLAQQRFPDFYLGFFEIAIVGVPNAILSLIYMLIFSKYLLPTKKVKKSTPESVGEDGDENPSYLREYTVSMIVTKKSSLVGKTVGSKGLHSLQGLKLFKIIRNLKNEEGETEIDEIDDNFVLMPGDTLFFQGLLDNISILYQLDGLVPATTQISKVKGRRKDRVLVEVVLASHSPHINKTIRETRFRSVYNAVIIAVHRHGVNLAQKIAEIQLQIGDTLLLETTKEFIEYHQNDSNFALVSEISRGETIAPRTISFSMVFTVILGGLMVILSALQIFSLLQIALVVACLYILLGYITWRQALACIQGETLLVIAAAFGLGNALQQSGAAAVISNSLVTVFSIGGKVGVIAGLFLTTGLLSSLISNGATVTLMFPIAVGFAFASDISIKAVCYTLMMAASCSFMTPVGFQTNLMVMSPGGYTTIDYIKFGFLITCIACVTTVSIVYLVWTDDFNPAYASYYT